MAEALAVETVAVIGAGAMGRGIAYCALAAGYKVRLTDANATQLAKARDWICTRAEKEGAAAALLSVDADIAQACLSADLVIEAVAENLDVKVTVLKQAAKAAGGDAVLATNTSGIPIGRIGEGVGEPQRVVGMHFFNPVPRMRLCEIVVGAATSARARDTAYAVAEKMGKTPVIAGDTPGFLASRLNCALGNEALRMLEQGVAAPDAIDTAAKLGLNHPMGPLELLDLVGLDVRLAALRTLAEAYGGGFAPTELHVKLVAEGRLGVKSGAGVYEYDEHGKKTSSAAAPWRQPQ